LGWECGKEEVVSGLGEGVGVRSGIGNGNGNIGYWAEEMVGIVGIGKWVREWESDLELQLGILGVELACGILGTWLQIGCV
jgi:hypothetical protein